MTNLFSDLTPEKLANIMANNKDIKKNKPKKEKKKRKPIYEIQGFVLTIPEERLKEMLLEMSKPNPEKE